MPTSSHRRGNKRPQRNKFNSLLVLQLRFRLSSMAYGGSELMRAPPVGPSPDEGGTGSGRQQQFGDQRAEFRHRQGADQGEGGAGMSVGLVLSRLPKALRRCSAESFARNAAATRRRSLAVSSKRLKRLPGRMKGDRNWLSSGANWEQNHAKLPHGSWQENLETG